MVNNVIFQFVFAYSNNNNKIQGFIYIKRKRFDLNPLHLVTVNTA